MPAIRIFRGLTTAPLASDDMHIACLILGFYRVIQLICLVPLWLDYYVSHVKGGNLYINSIPPWCSQYPDLNFGGVENLIPLFKGEVTIEYKVSEFQDTFTVNAVSYFAIDVAWIIIFWSSASIGTPTEPQRRDVYVRNLIKFKMFFSNIYPLVLLGLGLYYVSEMRSSNYGCLDGGYPVTRPDESAIYGLFCTLMVTYAFEILLWPSIAINKVVRVLRMNRFWDRSRLEGKAARFEMNLGMFLKCLACITRGKAGGHDLKNKGELKDFASHVMCLMNNQTNLGLVLTDMYIGMRMLSNVQAEKKLSAIKKMANKSKMLMSEQDRVHKHELISSQSSDNNVQIGQDEPGQGRKLKRRRSSIAVLEMKHDTYEICEREILEETNTFDQTTMSEAAHFVPYASKIYVELPNCVMANFVKEEVDECPGFIREPDTLYTDEYRLTSIGCDHAILCYSNFVNGIVATPYSVLIDQELESIVIVVRGTRSLEDLVVDLQFIPESLEKVGKICGFDGKNYFCHKGFLARCKWMYNDIKRNRVLKTLYSEESPFKSYPLVLCGHSLGAGCASILSLMLRPSFPSVKCFAFEPPGCIFDQELSEKCTEFITSFVRHDDLVPRLSYHNFETLRDEFFNVFTRIKVPKIELYFHLKKPYTERFVAVHNAQVLRPRGEISTNALFNKQLKQFRAERAEKNSRKEMSALFIPGRIVHLVDTGSDGHYIPYWAKRSEFNQLEMSKRMYSDHDIHSLVRIIRDMKLGGRSTVSVAFQNAPQIDDDDDEMPVTDIRLFACCSNPYGKLPLLLYVLGMVALALSVATGTECDLFHASIPTANSEYAMEILNSTHGIINLNFGLFKYDLLDCDNSSNVCDSIHDYTTGRECAPYPPNYQPGAFTEASRALHSVVGIVGSLAVFMLMISICYIYSPRTWNILTVLLLVVSACEGLVFIYVHDLHFCLDLNTDCTLGANSVKVIAACCIWFIMAIGTGYLAKVGKRMKQY